jgi:hypothetical protein
MASSISRFMPRRALSVALALVLVGAAAGIAAAAVTNDPGPFVGCLAAKTTGGSATTKGQIYNVAKSATTPLAACVNGDVQVIFSNAQGPQGIQGIQGIQGTNGTNGTDGTNGTNGTDGAAGPQGPAGGFSTITRTSTHFAGTASGGSPSYTSGDSLKAFCPSGQQAISGGYEFTDDPVSGFNPAHYLWYMVAAVLQDTDYQVTPELVDIDTDFIGFPGVTVFVNCVPS